MNTSKFLVSVLCAAAAGVVVGMLTAPEKGEDLRNSLRNSVNDLAKKLGDLIPSQLAGAKPGQSGLQEESQNFGNREYKRATVTP